MSAPNRVVATAPGKINLSLRVGGVDERGYHALATVFQALDLTETIEARRADHLTLTVDSQVRGHVPTDSSNLVLRAAEILRAEHGVTDGAALHITKRVPIAGGMGGGSADAAAALIALNTLWGLELTAEELHDLGARLGADVPFALHGGTALGLGNGTDLTAVQAPCELTWLLCAPGGHLSTPEVFRTFDRLVADAPPPVVPSPHQEQLDALGAGDLAAIAGTLSNDLTGPALAMRPDLEELLAALSGAGALAAILSGSGPTLGALVEDETQARRIQEAVAPGAPEAEFVIAGGPVPGARIIEQD